MKYVPPRIVVAGNLSLDNTRTPTGEMAAAPGGDALYAAIGARLWGADVRILTLVGDDYPAGHLARMESIGLGTGLIRRVDGPTVAYRVTYDRSGDRRFEFETSPARLSETSPTARDYARIQAADWLHVAAMPIDAQEVAVAAGRGAGLPTSLDPHEEFVLGHERRLAEMVRGTAFMPSELEARLLFPDLGDLDVEPFAAEAVARLDSWLPSLVVLKLGSLGSLVRIAGLNTRVDASATSVVDPTGAGDAYCGGFVAGWLITHSGAMAGICGTLAAAEMIGQFGAFRGDPWPTVSDLVDRAASMAHRLFAHDAEVARALSELAVATRARTGPR